MLEETYEIPYELLNFRLDGCNHQPNRKVYFCFLYILSVNVPIL